MRMLRAKILPVKQGKKNSLLNRVIAVFAEEEPDHRAEDQNRRCHKDNLALHAITLKLKLVISDISPCEKSDAADDDQKTNGDDDPRIAAERRQ